MGRRKSRAIVKKGPPSKLSTSFDCPYCGMERTIEVKMDRKSNLASLKCTNTSCQCHENVWQSRISYLDEAVDIYHNWIDECQGENEEGGNQEEPDDEDE
eukprot:GHVL01032404.1.p1 GENE.GHVL01032404.1~~GHVL01032404.1.p1  ORF type:complete len:100 (+),score=16.52 GHVL01032404.1:29-328(+)